MAYVARMHASTRIVVVDDNTDEAQALALMLEGMGHEVTVAHEGNDALRLCRKVRAEVVLLDPFLPGIDGYEVASRLREEFGTDMRILATGYGGTDVRQKLSQSGFDQHILKPIDPAFLESFLG